MKRTLLPILSLVLIFSFASCSKDEDEAGTTKKSNNELLVNKTWIMTNATVNPPYDFGNGATNDFFSQYDDCEKDDFIVYHADFTYSGDDGAVKCDPQDAQTWGGYWSLSTDQKSLTRDGDMLTLSSISETSMVLTDIIEWDGTSYTATYTFGIK